MSAANQPVQARYRAFLSYSHADSAAVARLHRQLERFRLPGSGERLAPIFRDMDELPAADSLPAAVDAALAQSGALLVCCSPAAAASRWVNLEITRFRALHPGRPVLAAIIDGTPDAALPPALTAGGHEPLAAELTGGREARQRGFLKLVAGLAGVPLDELVQREAQARLRRVTMVTAGALLAVVVMAALTITAIAARQEAERQRNEAEGLVEFMLTDLREKLRGVGRLDVMAAANNRVLTHCANLGDAATDSALEQCARLQHALGEDAMQRHDFRTAGQRLAQAHATTGRLLARAPQAPERLYAHGQSKFWLGDLAFAQEDWATTDRWWQQYRQLTRQLLQVAPDDPRSLREAGDGEGNICSLDIKRKRRTGVVASCQQGVRLYERALARQPEDEITRNAYLSRLSWLATALWAEGRIAEAQAARQRQIDTIQRFLAQDPRNAQLHRTLASAHRSLAGLAWDAGDGGGARRNIALALASLRAMRQLEPGNAEIARRIGEMAEEQQLYNKGVAP